MKSVKVNEKQPSVCKSYYRSHLSMPSEQHQVDEMCHTRWSFSSVIGRFDKPKPTLR